MRMEVTRRPRIDIPVLCVGNLTVGGAGKTPVAITLARQARRSRLKPGFLSRGYGGGISTPRLVDPNKDTVWQGGDEPLLLARHAPTATAANRYDGARLLMGEGCDFAIMDDGFQSARLHYDYGLIVVDTERGIGNGHVIPGGPMRAPLIAQIRRANALLRLGTGNGADDVVRSASRAAKPVYFATTRVLRKRQYAGKRVLAFAGIGNPQKFFDTLADIGAEIVATHPFPDHYRFSDEDLELLMMRADEDNLELVTTAKDAVRLTNGTQTARKLLKRLHVLEIETVFEPKEIAERIVNETLTNFRRRQYGG